MRQIITVLILVLSISGMAQDTISYQEANKKTYDASLQADWNTVITIGELAKANGHNFFYLNLRLGIAYYNDGQYFKAKKSLVAAYIQNPTNTTSLYYNYWNSLAIGENTTAEYYAKNITTEKQRLKSISVIGGLKKYNISEMGSNQYHLNIGSDFQFTSKLNTSILVSRISQDVIWGDYYQHQAAFSSNYQLSPKFNIEFNYNLIKVGGNVNFSDTENTITKAGTINQLSNTFYLGYGINLNRSVISMGLIYHNLFTDNNINVTSNFPSAILNNSNPVTSHYLQPQVGITHYFKQHKNGVWISSQISVPITSDSLGLSWNNTVKLKTSTKSWIGLNHHFNRKINAFENNGLTVQNGDFLSNRFGASWDYAIRPKTNFTLQLLRENKTEFFENINYNYNSIFGILTFKF